MGAPGLTDEAKKRAKAEMLKASLILEGVLTPEDAIARLRVIDDGVHVLSYGMARNINGAPRIRPIKEVRGVLEAFRAVGIGLLAHQSSLDFETVYGADAMKLVNSHRVVVSMGFGVLMFFETIEQA